MTFPSPRSSGLVLVAALLLFVTGCSGPSIEAVKALEPVDVVTGWFDDGIVEGGKNKLVPSVQLKFHNKSDAAVSSVQVWAVFKQVGDDKTWGEYFGWAVTRQGLAVGAETNPIVMHSGLGYTGEQPRMQMLQNTKFIDVKVEIFLKQGSKVWAKLAEYPIQRQLITK